VNGSGSRNGNETIGGEAVATRVTTGVGRGVGTGGMVGVGGSGVTVGGGGKVWVGPGVSIGDLNTPAVGVGVSVASGADSGPQAVSAIAKPMRKDQLSALLDLLMA